tara:strand:+ start:2237 stop:2677 length:441 start_codon:yes stop_codon:yes gene_type:complete
VSVGAQVVAVVHSQAPAALEFRGKETLVAHQLAPLRPARVVVALVAPVSLGAVRAPVPLVATAVLAQAQALLAPLRRAHILLALTPSGVVALVVVAALQALVAVAGEATALLERTRLTVLMGELTKAVAVAVRTRQTRVGVKAVRG